MENRRNAIIASFCGLYPPPSPPLQIFAIVVFACITTEGYVNPSHSPDAKCIFNQNDSACNYAVGIGVIAFLACVGFLVLDAYFPLMSSAEERKYVVLADLGFSGERELQMTSKIWIRLRGVN